MSENMCWWQHPPSPLSCTNTHKDRQPGFILSCHLQQHRDADGQWKASSVDQVFSASLRTLVQSSVDSGWDGKLANRPVSLLVEEGDIISLRPGSEAPTELRGIQVREQT
ncbi:unnamed protein product [Leuciscus chuanchicus]